MNDKCSELVCQIASQAKKIDQNVIEIKQLLLKTLNLCKLSKLSAMSALEEDCAILFGYMVLNSGLAITQEMAEQIVAQSVDLFALDNQF